MAKQTSQHRQRAVNPAVLKVDCLFCSRSSPSTIPKGWDWFTGYFDRTVYVCPVCQKEHWRAVTWLYKKALFAPDAPEQNTSLDAALKELNERQDEPEWHK